MRAGVAAPTTIAILQFLISQSAAFARSGPLNLNLGLGLGPTQGARTAAAASLLPRHPSSSSLSSSSSSPPPPSTSANNPGFSSTWTSRRAVSALATTPTTPLGLRHHRHRHHGRPLIRATASSDGWAGVQTLATSSLRGGGGDSVGSGIGAPSDSGGGSGGANANANAPGGLSGLHGLSVSELKRLLEEREVDYRDCIEKKELVARLEEAMMAGKTPRSPTEGTSGAGLLPEEERMVQLFRKVSPTVVFIETSQDVRQPFSMRALEVPQGTGSGFVWDDKGHIVTNYHVVQSAVRRSRSGGKIKVTLQGSATPFDAELVGAEPDKDLAVLRIVASKSLLTPIQLSRSSSDLLVGQKVLAIGNPFGLDHTLTTGIVSALGREVSGAGGRPLKGCVQTDAAINPGNSGGPLLDSQGNLIGVNTAILSASGASAGIGFAIPVDTVRRVVTQIIRYGRVQRPSLGVQVADDQIMRNIERQINAQLNGVMVTEINASSPAANPVSGKGLRGMSRRADGSMSLGDVITMVDKVPVRKVEDLLCAIEESAVGGTVVLTVRRQGTGKLEEVKVKLRERPAAMSKL